MISNNFSNTKKKSYRQTSYNTTQNHLTPIDIHYNPHIKKIIKISQNTSNPTQKHHIDKSAHNHHPKKRIIHILSPILAIPRRVKIGTPIPDAWSFCAFWHGPRTHSVTCPMVGTFLYRLTCSADFWRFCGRTASGMWLRVKDHAHPHVRPDGPARRTQLGIC